MPTSITSADSLLAIDVGSINTRAFLFDIVDGQYRYLATGASRTTAQSPFNDIREGIRVALEDLTGITGRVMVGEDHKIISPSNRDGRGVDIIVATISAGGPISIAVVGLLEDISLESAERLAGSVNCIVCSRISLNDRKRLDERINSLMSSRPDLVIVAGGSDGGSSKAVLNLVEAVGLASFFGERELRPEILFIGNQAIHNDVKKLITTTDQITFGFNVRPEVNEDRTQAALIPFGKLYCKVLNKKFKGVYELDEWTHGKLIPSSVALGDFVRTLSKIYGAKRGVLAIDIGATATSAAAAISGKVTLSVTPQYSMNFMPDKFASEHSLKELQNWLRFEVSESYLRDYIYTKATYPASIPFTYQDLDIEYAIARLMMRMVMISLYRKLDPYRFLVSKGVTPVFEPIIVSGRVLTGAPNLASSTLAILDGLQPAGISTLVLDKHQLIPALGAIARVNPLLVIQLLNTGTMQNLGVIISPIAHCRMGTPIMRGRVVYEDGKEEKFSIQQGTLETLSVASGQTAEIFLQPLNHCDVGMGGPGRSGHLRVNGGCFGVIIDARGRPLKVGNTIEQRHDMENRWLKKLELARV
jgi:hypothetical protein